MYCAIIWLYFSTLYLVYRIWLFKYVCIFLMYQSQTYFGHCRGFRMLLCRFLFNFGISLRKTRNHYAGPSVPTDLFVWHFANALIIFRVWQLTKTWLLAGDHDGFITEPLWRCLLTLMQLLLCLQAFKSGITLTYNEPCTSCLLWYWHNTQVRKNRWITYF